MSLYLKISFCNYAFRITWWHCLFSVSEIFMNILERWDISLSQKCAVASKPNHWLRPYLKLLEISCHGLPVIFYIFICFMFVKDEKNLHFYFNFFYAMILDLLLIGVSKALFRRQRPDFHGGNFDMFATVAVDNYSFPSGHASRAMLIMCLLLLDTNSFFRSLFVIVWTLAVSASRVVLGRHHVVDVAFGCLLGYVEFLIVKKTWIPFQTSMKIVRIFQISTWKPFHAPKPEIFQLTILISIIMYFFVVCCNMLQIFLSSFFSFLR